MKKLSNAARDLLSELAKPDAELTYSSELWLTDIRRWHPNTVKQLLFLCVIRSTYDDQRDKYELFEITAEGRQLLEDPNYEPEILKHLRKERTAREDFKS